MSREDFVILASRTLAVLMMVWALTEVSYVPTTLHSFLHYSNLDIVSHSPGSEYYKHSELISLCFRFFRIIGFSLLARWLSGETTKSLTYCFQPQGGKSPSSTTADNADQKHPVKFFHAHGHPMPRPAQDLRR